MSIYIQDTALESSLEPLEKNDFSSQVKYIIFSLSQNLRSK